jgi:polyphosphate glucokinase
MNILSIDIGGTGLKASVVNDKGKMLAPRQRVETPHPCPPPVLLKAITGLVKPLPAFARISIAFPGVVRDGKVLTAPNLGTADWAGFPLAAALSQRLGKKPAKLLNDAEVQGFAIVKGQGLELVLTLGTGCGTALFRDGELMPHMELGQHPAHGNDTYDEYIGNRAKDNVGHRRWNKRVGRAIEQLDTLLHFDQLHIGGGNARHLKIELPANARIESNDAGIEGGAALWRSKKPARPRKK